MIYTQKRNSESDPKVVKSKKTNKIRSPHRLCLCQPRNNSHKIVLGYKCADKTFL